MSSISEREIEGYMVRIVNRSANHVSLEWRDEAETDAAVSRGESHLMGFHDIEVPISVLLVAADMLSKTLHHGRDSG